MSLVFQFVKYSLLFNTTISLGLELCVEIVIPGKSSPDSDIVYLFISLLTFTMTNNMSSCTKIDCTTSPIFNKDWIFFPSLKTDIDPFPWPKFPSLAINISLELSSSDDLFKLLSQPTKINRKVMKIWFNNLVKFFLKNDLKIMY